MSNNPTAISVQSLRLFIQNDLLNDDSISIEDDQDLLMSGLLDSLNTVRLASYIEEQCSFAIPAEDMLIENFGSLNQIDTYIKSRLQA